MPDLRRHDGGHPVRGGPDLFVPSRRVADQGQGAQALAVDRRRVGQQRARWLAAATPPAPERRAPPRAGSGSARLSGRAAGIRPHRTGASPAPWPAGAPTGWKATAAWTPGIVTSRASTAGSAPSAVSSRNICATAKSSTAAADCSWRMLLRVQVRSRPGPWCPHMTLPPRLALQHRVRIVINIALKVTNEVGASSMAAPGQSCRASQENSPRWEYDLFWWFRPPLGPRTELQAHR